MSEESVLKVNSFRKSIGRPWAGWFLITAGIFLLIGQIVHFSLARYVWPGFLAGFGLLLCLPALRSTPGNKSQLAILSVPGAMILATSGLLFLSGLTGNHDSLLYTWPLILAGGAIGYGYSKRHERPIIDDSSYRFIRKSVIITMVLAIIFELVVFRGLGEWWPLLLIAGGMYIVINNRRGKAQ